MTEFQIKMFQNRSAEIPNIPKQREIPKSESSFTTRCIDVLELIENERLASFHAQTLKL